MNHHDAPRAGGRGGALAAALAAASLVGLLSLPVSASPAPADGGSPRDWAPTTQRGDHPPALASSLRVVAEAEPSRSSVGRPTPTPAVDATVVVEAADRATAAAGDRGRRRHRRARAHRPGQGDRAADALDELAAARRRDHRARAHPIILHVTSEGVAETQAAAWQTGRLRRRRHQDRHPRRRLRRLRRRGSAPSCRRPSQTDFARCGERDRDARARHRRRRDRPRHGAGRRAAPRLHRGRRRLRRRPRHDGRQRRRRRERSFGFHLTGRGDGSGGPNTIAGAAASCATRASSTWRRPATRRAATTT